MSTAGADNPLLRMEFRIPFDRIGAAHVEPAVREALVEARRRRDGLAAATSGRTFANTLEPLDALTDRLDYALGLVKHLEGVKTSPELRAAYNAVQPAATEFYSSLPLDAGLWAAIREYAGSPEAAALPGVRKRYLSRTVDSFRRHGAELDPPGKARLAAIEVELGQLTTRFGENVLDATNAFELVVADESKLAGLPPSAVAAARQSAAGKGLSGWRFTLQAPSYTAVMTYLDDADIRERIWRAHATRSSSGSFDNRQILRRIVELRLEKATLVGYRDFADFATADRMAKTGERARTFLEELRARTEPHFQRENRELEDFRGAPLKPWDVAYWAERLRKSLYDFDEEALRPYFPLDLVVEGMFEIARRLFGVRITEDCGVPVWHPQVRCYSVRDEDGALLGSFYADWHPREDKRGGAWMDALVTGVQRPTGLEPHVGVICGNLTPPVDGKPALLTHREVETVFHEFGHLLHHCLSRVEIRGLSGANVAWDFVELPSQIMENWCWEREALDLFARHYQTREPLPEELYRKMKRARTFRSANAQMRQIGFGFVDFGLHSGGPPAAGADLVAESRRVMQAFFPVELPAEHSMITAFTHLFADPVGYAAGYYSYKWAEVLDADAFSKFKARGVFDPETGRRFRDTILSQGDSADPADLFRAFMGRDPDPGALMQRLGLAG
ncbi:MAG: M3 family metallopeptidase [Bryobacterales bacterium]|nr:M3 family metallopeptidase [Bryobacterales bacterium]